MRRETILNSVRQGALEVRGVYRKRVVLTGGSSSRGVLVPVPPAPFLGPDFLGGLRVVSFSCHRCGKISRKARTNIGGGRSKDSEDDPTRKSR